MVVSKKHADFPSPSPEIYQKNRGSPPPLESNLPHSHFGIGSPVFRNFKAATTHKVNFTGPPRGFERPKIHPDVKDRLSNAHWEIGTPSAGPVVNTIA